MGLNGGDQSIIIELPEPLHSGSSVTNDDHPYLRINIPFFISEEQDHATPPLSGTQASQQLLLLGNPGSLYQAKCKIYWIKA